MNANVMMVCMVLVFAVGLPGVCSRNASAKRNTLKLKMERVTDSAADGLVAIEANDSIRRLVVFAGFDKKASSASESFFVSNNTTQTLVELSVELRYNDMSGRLLHVSRETIDVVVPPGETRKVDIKSWDTQKSFYYRKSGLPKRQATPFDVEIRLISVMTRNESR